MSHLKRRLIFCFLVVVFVIVTPPVILYAMGYSFDWQKKELMKTGGVYLKSLPNNADIFIDGQKRKTTPRLISRLTPKIYSIEITKDGFSSWKKSLEINPEVVTEARNIILFPQKIPPEKVSDSATSTIADWLMTPEEKQNYLQAQQIASSSAGWLNKNSSIFYIDNSNFILYRQDFGGFIKKQLTKEPLPKNNYKLSISANNRFLAADANGALFLLNKDTEIFEKIDGQTKNAEFSGDNKKILIRTANELWVVYIEDVLIPPYKKAGERELITRHSQPISQAIFYPDNEHIAFVVNNQIKITELDGRDQRNTVDLIAAANPQIYFDEPDFYLYYLTQNELFRVKLKL